MRLVLISDTHGARPEVPVGDLLIHCGDLTHLGSFAEFKSEVAWLKSLPHKYKVIIGGNHDACTFNLYQAGKEADLRKFLHPIVYLRDSAYECEDFKIYGSPWIQPYCGIWDTADMREVWQNVPTDTQILVTHTPPQGILDSGYGCPELRKALGKLDSLKLHAFGHVEESYGQTKIDNTLFANAAISTRRGDGGTRKPLAVEL